MTQLYRRLLALFAATAAVSVLAVPAEVSAAGTCISNVGTHRDYYHSYDGYVSYEQIATSAVRVGVEVRQASDCTSGGLLWIDAIACMEKLHGRLNASDLQSVALYGTSGALLANNNVGVYENYRDGSGPTKICASTPDVRVGLGSNAVYAAVRGAYNVTPCSGCPEYAGGFRHESSDSPARYRRI